MTRYVDVAIIPVPTDNIDAYREMAATAGEVWLEHGAREYFEGTAEDVMADGGSMGGITDLAGATADETVILSFIAFDSHEHRDEVHAAVMDDPVYREHFAGEMPFDPGRITSGGFASIVSFPG